MNERIKELAVEADFMLCEDGNFYSEGQLDKITDKLAKFAELIVRECATLIDAEEIQSSYGNMLKEHFGVEE